MPSTDTYPDYMTGEELLAEQAPDNREEALDTAIRALMLELEQLHCEHKKQSLIDNLHNPLIHCSCADAYRMGAAALEWKAKP